MPAIKVADFAFPRMEAPDLDQMEEFLTHFGLVRAERLRVEDDEAGVDATPAERLHVRPADPRHVDGAVSHPERHA